MVDKKLFMYLLSTDVNLLTGGVNIIYELKIYTPGTYQYIWVLSLLGVKITPSSASNVLHIYLKWSHTI